MIEKSLSLVAYNSKVRLVILALSSVVCAFGQPDRSAFFPFIAYLLGYSSATLVFLECKTRKERAILSFLWASFLELFQLNWLATTYYHGSSIIGVYLFLSLGIAAQWTLLFSFLPLREKIAIRHAILLASLWCVIEWSRLYYLCGFPFNSVGLVLTFSAVGMQMASLFGVYGLSFWVIFCSVLGAVSWQKSSKKYLLLWIFSLVLPFFFGAIHKEIRKQSGTLAPTLDVALIQTGLTSEQKWQLSGRGESSLSVEEQWERIFTLLQNSGQKTFDLIVLPEVALPKEAYEASISYAFAVKQWFPKKERLPPLVEPLAQRSDEGNWFVSHAWISQALANLYKSRVIIGLLDYDEALDETYNSAFYFLPFQKTPCRYNKRVLVPLAEYLPLSLLKSFMEKFGIFGFFTPGEKSVIFPGSIPIATSICYEEGYNYLMREGKVKGARLFVNISNDGWFPRSRLPIEHYNLGKVRAIENGVPVLRSCNTGVTAIINSYGETLASLEERDAKGNLLSGCIAKKISCHSYPTLFSITGNALILSISIVAIALNSKFR